MKTKSTIQPATEMTKALSVPRLTDAQLADLQSDSAEIRASGLVSLFEGPWKSINVPAAYVLPMREARFVQNVLHASFDLLGGMKRFLWWADQNPDEFYKLYIKLGTAADQVDKAMGVTLNVTNNIGKSPLDEATYQDAHVIDPDATKDD